jgi:hypothetical protein
MKNIADQKLCTELSCWRKSYSTRLRCSYVQVIATKIIRSSSQSDWPLRNIYISKDNGSFTFYVDISCGSSFLVFYIVLICVCTVVSNKYCVVFCFVFLRLVCPMLPISLDCPFLIASSVLSKVYSLMKPSLVSLDIYNYWRHRYTEDTCQRFLLKKNKCRIF